MASFRKTAFPLGTIIKRDGSAITLNFVERGIMVLDEHTSDIQVLCKTHKVKRLYAFGSVLTDAFNPASDIDLIVDFEPMDAANYADNYFDFKFSLQDILKRPIDLLEEKAIRNPYFKQAINKKRQIVYGR